MLDNSKLWSTGFNKPMKLGVKKKVPPFGKTNMLISDVRESYDSDSCASPMFMMWLVLPVAVRPHTAPAPWLLMTGGPILCCVQLVVLTCMDSRLIPEEILGLDVGDAEVIRNGGGRVTMDVLRYDMGPGCHWQLTGLGLLLVSAPSQTREPGPAVPYRRSSIRIFSHQLHTHLAQSLCKTTSNTLAAQRQGLPFEVVP